MDRERFTEHLAAPMGRGVVLSGGFDGHAGGALCGDLIRVSVRVAGDRVRRGGLRRLGLRRADRGRQRGRHARVRRAAARRRCGSGRGRSRPSSAGSRPASCTPPIWSRTRCTAHWAPRAPTPRCRWMRARTLVAMSGGRRLRGRGAAGDARGTLRRRGHGGALARRGQRRRGVLLLGRRRPARPLGRAPDGHAARHAGSARRVPRGRRGPVPVRLRGGGDAEPVRRLQRPRAAGRDARARDASGLRRPGDRPLRAGDGRRAAARRRRPGQGPDLHALRALARSRWRGCGSRWRS